MSLGEFFAAILPLAAISLVGLFAATYIIKDEPIKMHLHDHKAKLEGNGLFTGYLFLFVLNLLVVLRVAHWIPVTIITIAISNAKNLFIVLASYKIKKVCSRNYTPEKCIAPIAATQLPTPRKSARKEHAFLP